MLVDKKSEMLEDALCNVAVAQQVYRQDTEPQIAPEAVSVSECALVKILLSR